MLTRLEGIFKVIGELFPGKPTWNVNDMPDLTGKIIIVTGSNVGAQNIYLHILKPSILPNRDVGIGFETAKAYLINNQKE
jgi:hypothetical protein